MKSKLIRMTLKIRDVRILFMVKCNSTNKTMPIQKFSLFISGFIYGVILWMISGISPFGYYSAERFSTKEIIIRWLLLSICITFPLFLSILIHYFLLGFTSWIRLFFSSIIVLNMSFLFLTFVNNLLVNASLPMCHLDNVFSTFIFENLFSFLKGLIIVNVVFISLSVINVTACYLLNKYISLKKLP